jgi:enoyl-CoA hydratase
MADAVSVEVDGGVAVITINRPEARNAVNEAVARGVAAAIDELDPRPDVAVLVLTGAGGTFCAGMDLKGFLSGENPATGRPSRRPWPRSRGTPWPAGSRSRSPAT